jgi:tRNA threonylcarbamoyladenosine modification (KEOPS) complex  Pcc1 subunit
MHTGDRIAYSMQQSIFPEHLNYEQQTSMISGFRRDVNLICFMLGFYAA